MSLLHMIKLVVGVDDLDDFAAWHAKSLFSHDGRTVNAVHTRNWPRRQGELLEGGSIYRVIKGRILCRQKIVDFAEGQNDEYGRHCMILVEPEIIQTVAQPHRPFQGWRYLTAKDAPQDRGKYGANDEKDAPEDLKEALRASGLL